MSQLILDDQLNARAVLAPIQKWATASRLQSLRPGEQILDDRVPEILRSVKLPTFITIDVDYWDQQLCHPGYCVLYFALQDKEQRLIPKLLRALFRMPEFASRSSRMGKIARISRRNIVYWEFEGKTLHIITWKKDRKKRG